VRELKNAVESAAVLTTDEIAPSHLPGFITSGGGGAEKAESGNSTQNEPTGLLQRQNPAGSGLDDLVRAFEKGLIVEALTQSRGVQVKAAARLKIKERSLWHRLKKHQIDASEFKRGDQ
jgi:DNA-binding NtrC family response regulator